MRNINKIIVHCSATPEGRVVTVKDIDEWHKQRGFTKIGYHYVIYLDGAIHLGRKEEEVGAHCLGYNANSIGVCYIGGLAKDGETPKDTRTGAQRESLLVLLKKLKARYPKAGIYGHCNFASKACPCFDAKAEYKSL